MHSVTGVKLLATPDGALWAGLADATTGQGPTAIQLGAIVRSTDDGATWSVGGSGYSGGGVHQLRLSRTGQLYAATERSIWRTRERAYTAASEAAPAEASGVGLSVHPNPSGGRAEVVLSLAEAKSVRVSVVDARGREVAVLHDGPARSGEQRLAVDTTSWPAGVYVVRAAAGQQSASARLVVAR